MTRTPHPAALAGWSAACLVAGLASTSPAYRAVVLAAAAVMVAVPPRPGAGRRPLLVVIGLAGAGAVLVNFLVSHTGATALVTIPEWVPVFGGPLTVESAAFGGGTALALAAGILAVAPLSLLLETDQLIDAIPRSLERTGLALAATVGLGPGLVRSLTSIREAQAMRGWRPRGPRSWAEVMVPAFLTAMDDSIRAAEAMEARAFGSGRRTPPDSLAWRPADVLMVACAALTAGAFIGARLAGLNLDWAAYPTLETPPADAWLLAAAALPALPALVTWRSRG